MNDNNPAGRITQSKEYATVLGLAVAVSFVVSIKRCLVGLTLGRQTYRESDAN